MNRRTLFTRRNIGIALSVLVIVIYLLYQANQGGAGNSGGSSRGGQTSGQNNANGGDEDNGTNTSENGGTPTSANEPEQPSSQIGQRSKSSGCKASNALPDSACTPGAVFANATKDDICRLGYARSVRNVPQQEKSDVYNSYGIKSHQPGEYEIDHLVSLELGGSNDIANLWPEPASPQPGFHEKDRYENYAHDQVCNGEITLQEAQRRIATDWLKYWNDAGRP